MSRRSAWWMAAWALALPVAGCAGAVPALAGAHGAPAGRAEVMAGGAARVPLGELAPAARGVAPSVAGGLAPVASVRYGVARWLDVGLAAAGPLGRLEARGSLDLHVGKDPSVITSLVAAPAGYVGVAEGDLDVGRGTRVGADLPVTIGVDLYGTYELWAGLRLGVERVSRAAPLLIDFAGETGGLGLRAGALVGLGVGFRHLHVLLELGASYEHWSLDGAGLATPTRAGLALTPAFALRLRP